MGIKSAMSTGIRFFTKFGLAMLWFILTLIVLPLTLAFSQLERSVGALYFISNDPSGNSVIINAIGLDGKLSYAGSVPTGGNGMDGLFPGGPPGAGSLFSQGSVAVNGPHLFVVNAGSNTVSMFSINPTDPLKIRMVGRPVSSGGEFPVSVDVSPSGDVCVLNGGKINGVYCYTVDSEDGMNPHGKFYNLGLNFTTPPVGPPGTASQVLFSEDGSKLRVSIKGTPSATTGAPPLTEGFVATWDVANDGSLSPTYTKAVPGSGDGLEPYGVSNIPGAPNALFVTDESFGVIIYDFTNPNVTFKPLAIESQIDTCWVAYSKSTDSFWVTDALSRKIYEISVDGRTLSPTLESTILLADMEYPFDNVVASIQGKDYLYVMSPVTLTFEVFSLKKGTTELIQTYDFGNEAKGVNLSPLNIEGAAVYVI